MNEIKQIVVGVDGSESSRAALEWAYNEAAHHGASLVAVSTWHPPTLPLGPGYGSMPPEGYESQPERDARDVLERLTEDLEPRTPEVDVRISISKRKPSQSADRYVPKCRPASGRVRGTGASRACYWAR